MENKIYLRAFEHSDLDLLNSIRNDDTLFSTTTGNKYYISSEHDKKWIEDKIFNNSNQLYLVICCSEKHQPMGYTSANNIDYLNRKAEWGGMVISKDFNSKGMGTEAGYLFLDHLFGELGMNMVYAYVNENNKASYRLSEKYGFTKDGLIRDFVYKQNRFHNAYIFSMLRGEYEKLQLNRNESINSTK
ncbi:MAG: GNAT family protein [Solibacillus sp.]|uniref:GNAT family N-acetyltransferase n=1 Tax=Solibacillus sp. TaxID=1909654 RepID=UPI003315BDAF